MKLRSTHVEVERPTKCIGTSIDLDDYRAIRALADAKGRKLSELIRESIAAYVTAQTA